MKTFEMTKDQLDYLNKINDKLISEDNIEWKSNTLVEEMTVIRGDTYDECDE